MLASITLENLTLPQAIYLLKRADALAADWVPPEGIVFLALWAWILILMAMFWKFMK